MNSGIIREFPGYEPNLLVSRPGCRDANLWWFEIGRFFWEGIERRRCELQGGSGGMSPRKLKFWFYPLKLPFPAFLRPKKRLRSQDLNSGVYLNFQPEHQFIYLFIIIHDIGTCVFGKRSIFPFSACDAMKMQPVTITGIWKTELFWILGKFGVKIVAYCREKIESRFYPGDLVTHTGDLEVCSVSGRLPDNPGELA